MKAALHPEAMIVPVPSPGCPTADRPVPAREGLLARLCVPGGRLPAGPFRRFAGGCRALGIDGLDITNRANLQVRGLTAAQAGRFADLARADGLLPREHAARRRAIVTSPLAGLDPREAADSRPLAEALDRFLLGSARAEAMTAKCGLGVDGGGTWPIRQASLDLVLEAAGERWRIVLAGHDAGLATTADAATAVLAALLDLLAEAGAGRVKDLLATAGLECVRQRLLATPGVGAVPVALPRPAARAPVGVIETREPGRVALGAIAPFGVLSWDAALAAARAADELGGGEVRLSPWRGLVIPGLPREAAGRATRMLEAAGLSTDPDTSYAVLHACPGSAGCLRGTGDVRGEAAAVAAALGRLARGVRHIHVSGCERGCAWPRRADLLLLADGRGGYALRREANARVPGDGTLVADDLAPGQAAGAAVAALRAPEADRTR